MRRISVLVAGCTLTLLTSTGVLLTELPVSGTPVASASVVHLNDIRTHAIGASTSPAILKR